MKFSEDKNLARDLFVFPRLLGTKSISIELTRLADGLPKEFSTAVQSLDANLHRMKTTAGIPFTLSWLAETKLVQERIRNSAKFKAADLHNPLQPDFGAKVEVSMAEITQREFSAFLNSEIGASAIEEGAARHLMWSTKFQDGELKAASNDLILQSVIALWGAYEAFCSDIVRALLNQNPSHLKSLMASEDAKRRFGKLKWSLIELLEVGLNLSTKVGDLLLEENDLSDYASIKATLEALFPNDEGLRAALDDSRLRILAKSRNLLAHRGGIVDTKFQKETGLATPVGTILNIDPTGLCEYLEAVGTSAKALLHALRATLKLPDSTAPL